MVLGSASTAFNESFLGVTGILPPFCVTMTDLVRNVTFFVVTAALSNIKIVAGQEMIVSVKHGPPYLPKFHFLTKALLCSQLSASMSAIMLLCIIVKVVHQSRP